MWIKWLPLFLFAAVLESIGQLSFKKAATAYRDVQGMRYYVRLATSVRVLGGILAYGIEMVVWVFLLSRIPLSIAFPLSGLQQLVILLASYVFLHERIHRVEWIGAGLIVVGLLAIATAG